jgi:carbonic anhydrase/acetyltransferase-like protein (isoleucine patch superfamily)
VVKPICYPNNNLDKIALAIIMYAVIGIGIVTLQTVTPVIAINGEELSSLRGGNGSLTTMTNESDTHSSYSTEWPNIHSNVKTDFNTNISLPEIQGTAFIHPFAVVIGNCYIGKLVLVAPTAVCRGDEGTPIYISDYSNMQDGVILHGLETTENGENIDGRRISAAGDRLMANSSQYAEGYSVFVGTNTSLAHDSMVHGPAWVGNNTFVGMKSIIFDATVGNNVAIGISSTISNGVSIPDNKFVPPGSVILTQEEADALPLRVGSAYENTNTAVLHVNEQLAEGYNSQQSLEKLVEQREKQMEKGMLETGMSAR